MSHTFLKSAQGFFSLNKTTQTHYKLIEIETDVALDLKCANAQGYPTRKNT